MKTIFILGIYLLILNILGFAFMGIDKRRAIRSAFRIPEATLFAIAILGGSIGSILGMHLFRHKTKHKAFTIGLPIILLIQIAITVYLWVSPQLNITIQ